MSYTVARVAAGYAQDPRAVVAWDWIDTLVWAAALDEVERVHAITRHGDAVTQAALTAQAYHKPERLRDAADGVRRLARLDRTVDPEAARTATEALLARVALAERVARRKRRKGTTDPILTVLRGD